MIGPQQSYFAGGFLISSMGEESGEYSYAPREKVSAFLMGRVNGSILMGPPGLCAADADNVVRLKSGKWPCLGPLCNLACAVVRLIVGIEFHSNGVALYPLQLPSGIASHFYSKCFPVWITASAVVRGTCLSNFYFLLLTCRLQIRATSRASPSAAWGLEELQFKASPLSCR